MNNNAEYSEMNQDLDAPSPELTYKKRISLVTLIKTPILFLASYYFGQSYHPILYSMGFIYLIIYILDYSRNPYHIIKFTEKGISLTNPIFSMRNKFYAKEDLSEISQKFAKYWKNSYYNLRVTISTHSKPAESFPLGRFMPIWTGQGEKAQREIEDFCTFYYQIPVRIEGIPVRR